MLSTVTMLVDYGAMAITLWLAIYLLGRGFPSRVALRAVVVLLALSLFFSSAFINFFYQIRGATAFRAVLLVIGMATWYSLTFHLLPTRDQRKLGWFRTGIYIWGLVVAGMLIRAPAFIGETENLLYVGRMGVGLPYVLYGLFQVLACGGILYNLFQDNRIGLRSQARYLMLASIFPIAAAGYGILALAITPPMPRVVQDLLIFSGVFLLGLSVARDQMLVERRITLGGFLISGSTLLGIAGIYTYLSWKFGFSLEIVAAITVLTILTHSIYDLVREFLERRRSASQNILRRQISQIERELTGNEQLYACLQEGLDLLCNTIRASGGFIATRNGENFVVAATRHTLPLGSQFPNSEISYEDIAQPDAGQFPDIDWIAPVFEADSQVALMGVGFPKKRLHYSADDMDLISEFAERVGTLVSLSNSRPNKADQLRQFVDEVHSDASYLQSRADEMMGSMELTPDPELIKMVEEGLRQLTDCIALGELPLVDWAGISGGSYIERGKRLQEILLEGIEALRPEGTRPGEPLPRVWYNYAVLQDAYVEGVTNREIMARLYISEGTFNRTRRNALRGLARLLLEKTQAAATA